jgi:hypothetical protein
MEGNEFRDEELSRLISDEYAGKILSATYKHPMSVQQISRGCSIPIAVAYRRVAKMEERGLIKCVGYEEVYRGKKVSYYECAVNMAMVTSRGQVRRGERLPADSELSRVGPLFMTRAKARTSERWPAPSPDLRCRATDINIKVQQAFLPKEWGWESGQNKPKTI